jgi:hypothetical protein
MHEQEALALSRGEATALEDYLAGISAVLADPERYVKRETVRLRINRMNIKVESPDEPGDELTFSEVTIGGRPPRVVVLTRFPRSDLLVKGAGVI